MSSELTKHAPGWVYNMADYRQMFDLVDEELQKEILDYPGGISSFNAQMHELGHHVVSGDEAYQFNPEEIKNYAENVFQADEAHLRKHLESLKLRDEKAIDAILQLWHDAKDKFLQDYEKGKQEGRYQSIGLPKFPYEFHHFKLALCSDMLFHTQLSEHISPQVLMNELCRVAEEVRVFPLLNEKGEIADDLGPVMLELQQQNFGIEVREVPYEQHKGGDAMLRVWAKECVIE